VSTADRTEGASCPSAALADANKATIGKTMFRFLIIAPLAWGSVSSLVRRTWDADPAVPRRL
jgi:hypothetical protein